MKPSVGAGHARDSERAVQTAIGERLDGGEKKCRTNDTGGASHRHGPNRGHGPLLQKNRPAILGFGNRLWRDDGAGSILAELLQKANPGAPIFDGGMVPENFLEKVASTKPASILLVDAGDFGGAPGDYCYLSGEDLAFTGISTHAGSPRMLATYLEVRTGAEVSLLVIQPGDTGQGDGLSPPVEETVSRLAEELSVLVGAGHARDSESGGQSHSVNGLD